MRGTMRLIGGNTRRMGRIPARYRKSRIEAVPQLLGEPFNPGLTPSPRLPEARLITCHRTSAVYLIVAERLDLAAASGLTGSSGSLARGRYYCAWWSPDPKMYGLSLTWTAPKNPLL